MDMLMTVFGIGLLTSFLSLFLEKAGNKTWAMFVEIVGMCSIFIIILSLLRQLLEKVMKDLGGGGIY